MSGRWAQQPKVKSHVEVATHQNDSRQHDATTTFTGADNQPSAACYTAPHYPVHFTKGSVIQLANGDLKRIEDLSTDDFVQSANISMDLCLDTSVVRGITPVADRGTVMLEFTVGQKLQASSSTHCVYTLCIPWGCHLFIFPIRDSGLPSLPLHFLLLPFPPSP